MNIDRAVQGFQSRCRSVDTGPKAGTGSVVGREEGIGSALVQRIPAGRRSRSGSLWISSGRFPAHGQVTRPLVLQRPSALKQVRAGIGCLDPVPDHMRQGCLNHLPGMICLFSRPVPAAGPETVRRDRTAAPGAGLSPSSVWPGPSTPPRPDRSLLIGANAPLHRAAVSTRNWKANFAAGNSIYARTVRMAVATSRWGKACRCSTTSRWGPRTGPIRSQGLLILNSMATAHSNTARRRTRRAVFAFSGARWG